MGVVLSLLLGVQALQAQNSVYSVLGVGLPGRPIGVRERALGGGASAVDLRAAVNPAALTIAPQLTVMATVVGSYRGYDIGGTSVDGLHETQFPFAMIAGRLPRTRYAVGVSIATYADRSYDLEIEDTVTLRGSEIAVADRVSSDGAIADARFAVGAQLSRSVSVGAGLHLITGSADVLRQRDFDDPDFAAVRQESVESFSGLGWSVGTLIEPSRRLLVGLAVRSDARVTAESDSAVVTRVGLPLTVTAGFRYSPQPAIRWSVTSSWRSWSDAAADLAAVGGANAFDTWEVGTGIELGGPGAGSAVPLRVGFRYAKLPFSPSGEQPRELDFSGGTEFRFAGGRAILALAVERAVRDGGGTSERAWNVSAGMLIQP